CRCDCDRAALPSFPTRRSSDLFGEQRLRQVFSDTPNPGDLFDQVHQRVLEFIGGAQRSDDLGMVEVTVMPEQALGIEAERLSGRDRKSTRLNSSHVKISYAVFC